jgi:hypothetical protein
MAAAIRPGMKQLILAFVERQGRGHERERLLPTARSLVEGVDGVARGTPRET